MYRHQEFNRFAEQCKELMEACDVAIHVQQLQAMAKTWCELAAKEERIADLVQALDDLFDGTIDRRASGTKAAGNGASSFKDLKPVSRRDLAPAIGLDPTSTELFSEIGVPLASNAYETSHPEQQPLRRRNHRGLHGRLEFLDDDG